MNDGGKLRRAQNYKKQTNNEEEEEEGREGRQNKANGRGVREVGGTVEDWGRDRVREKRSADGDA